MPSNSFRTLTPEQRRRLIFSEAGIPASEGKWIGSDQPPIELAETWIENTIGYFSIPLGIADHFVIDGFTRRIPLAIEETSIVAALSSAAKWVKEKGTLITGIEGWEGIGQIQFPRVRNPEAARTKITEKGRTLLALANDQVPGLVSRGGVFKRFEVRVLERPNPEDGSTIVIHLYCDTCDAMGANLINQACEIVSGTIAEWIGEECGMRILSNLTDSRRAWAKITLRDIDAEISRRIQEASLFAEIDPYRAATHNKGIMNGVDGVLLATGNDWRATEAGAHAYAARSGRYSPLSTWRTTAPGVLEGKIDLPISLGTVGGVTRTHPSAAACLKILGSPSARELARIVAAVGLTQNLAALRALTAEGIVAGHMRLHISNVVLASDAGPPERDALLRKLQERFRIQRRISAQDAREILAMIRAEKFPAL